MAAEENRLAHFKRLVESQSPLDRAGKPVLKEGYRAVADATGLKYDYVYQVYAGKSGKKGLGAQAVKLISEAYGAGKPPGWMDQPIDDTDLDADFEPLRPPTLEEAWTALGSALASLDDIGREMAVSILTSLAKSPEKPEMSFQMIETLVRVHGQAPKEPPPPAPSRKKVTTSAPAARAGGKASLVLKIGGGQKQQFDLPLSRSAFKPSRAATESERAWYDLVKAVPKASAD